MNDRDVVNYVRDFLRTNLEDPLTQYGEATRIWIHTDNPLAMAKYPRIKISKRGPTNNQIISMGENDFSEWRSMIIDIEIWVKLGFKWKDNDDEYVSNAEFIKEYYDKIWLLLKANHSWFRRTYGITGFKNMGEADPEIDVSEQFYKGILPLRVWYFV